MWLLSVQSREAWGWGKWSQLFKAACLPLRRQHPALALSHDARLQAQGLPATLPSPLHPPPCLLARFFHPKSSDSICYNLISKYQEPTNLDFYFNWHEKLPLLEVTRKYFPKMPDDGHAVTFFLLSTLQIRVWKATGGKFYFEKRDYYFKWRRHHL